MTTVVNQADRVSRNPYVQSQRLILMEVWDHTRVKRPSAGPRQPYVGQVSWDKAWSAFKCARSSGQVSPIRTQHPKNVISKIQGRYQGKWVVLLQLVGRFRFGT